MLTFDGFPVSNSFLIPKGVYMLDITVWIFAQLAIFLFLLVFLNQILFKPFLTLFKERDERINGSLDSAKSMDKEKETLFQQLDSKMIGARNKAKAVFDDLNMAGLEIQKNSVEEAKKGAASITLKAREDIETEAKKARESLKKDVESFSKKIIEKMVGI